MFKIDKNVIAAPKLGHNSVKIQNFQNPKRNFVEEYVGSLYTKNQANWAIFKEFFRLFVETIVPKSQRENQKNLRFSAKTRPIFIIF